MKYASVCSGVEAASLAWMPLGWEAAWFSEIEPFPCAVLKHRFPNVPNLGDMTKIKVERMENGDQKFTGERGVAHVPGGIDLLVGGTPCQSFSVAGRREGLEGASGLAKSFVELLGAMRPRWFVWENVPGCLSAKNKRTGTYDFNFLLAAFAERGYSLCWRILDAQYVRVDGYPRAIPQRRRRVFVVGHIGADWQYPASVLFEPDSLFRDTPPRRVKGKGFTGNIENRSGMAYRTWDPSGVNPTLNQCNAGSGIIGASNQELFGRNMNGLVMESHFSIGNGQAAETSAMLKEASQTLSRSNGGFSYITGITNQNFYRCYENHAQDRRIKDAGDVSPQLNAKAGTGGNNLPLVQECKTTAVAGNNHFGLVRRLLPVETERLMGFPDNWTRIPWRGKPAEDCPDGPRYKACGNSMCVNVMRWIGMRIELAEGGKL